MSCAICRIFLFMEIDSDLIGSVCCLILGGYL